MKSVYSPELQCYVPDPEWVHERSIKQYPFNLGYAGIFEHGYRTAIGEFIELLKQNAN